MKTRKDIVYSLDNRIYVFKDSPGRFWITFSIICCFMLIFRTGIQERTKNANNSSYRKNFDERNGHYKNPGKWLFSTWINLKWTQLSPAVQMSLNCTDSLSARILSCQGMEHIIVLQREMKTLRQYCTRWDSDNNIDNTFIAIVYEKRIFIVHCCRKFSWNWSLTQDNCPGAGYKIVMISNISNISQGPRQIHN